MLEFARVDVRALTSQEPRMVDKIGVVFFNLGLHAVLLYRAGRWFCLHRMQPVAYVISYVSSLITGAQISPRAEIGKGLVIYHPQGIVIGAKSVIGDFCTLVHGNVIGQLYGGGDRPTIGDFFFAGTGAKILGRIRIGNRVQVGPNTVIINSLPDEVTVAATPARTNLSARLESYPNRETLCSETILQRVLSLLRTTLDLKMPLDSVNKGTHLVGEGIGLDSIEVLRLVGAMEEEFNLTIEETELNISDFRTLGTLVNFVQERLSR
jgi:serine O-acetyltransferase